MQEKTTNLSVDLPFMNKTTILKMKITDLTHTSINYKILIIDQFFLSDAKIYVKIYQFFYQHDLTYIIK